MQKKIATIFLILLLAAQTSFAFLFEVTVLTKDQIASLSNEALLSTYIDVVAEQEAVQSFHQTSGFNPREYREYKNLVKFRINLIDEINKRDLEIPGAPKSPTPVIIETEKSSSTVSQPMPVALPPVPEIPGKSTETSMGKKPATNVLTTSEGGKK